MIYKQYLQKPKVQRYDNIEIVRGNAEYRGMSIEEQLKNYGAWYLLLCAHDHIWKNVGFPFRTRYEASDMLWKLCNEIHYNQGKKVQNARQMG